LGFLEVGTVTPLPQTGNPRPRLFRLPLDEALINRMGFNNAGAAALARNVMLARRHLPPGFVIGVNIGRGASTPPEEATADYLEAFRLVAPVADYVAINISSPNTPGLRNLQQPETLRELLETLWQAGEREDAVRPLLVKLAPDLEADAFAALVATVAEHAAGLILNNTTVARHGLQSPQRDEVGGLSGKPLRERMLEAVARARALMPRPSVIVATGGIGSAAEVADAYAAGADLVQLWTGLVYRGPGLIGEAVAVPAG
ncbi:MAG TPA: quinone-dependent dihydroorotate dehydrogenase, partial [Candidatus Limnocylindria bacterium]